MTPADLDGAIWPTDDEELLLRAALLEDDDAADAWRQLRPRFVYEDTSAEEQRLLPLVYRRLAAAGIDDPDLPRMKGLHRRAWYQNQLRLKDLGRVAALLREAGIETLALKGAPLLLQYYRQPGLRPMGDLDVLVPLDQRDAALVVLREDGWMTYKEGLRRTAAYQHATALHHPSRGDLDLHWHVAVALMVPGDRAHSWDDFWQASACVDLDGAPLRVPDPADLLLHVIVHGYGWIGGVQLHWIADAATILRQAANELDWDRLVAQAEKRHVVLMVGSALRYLQVALDVAVPQEVLTRLDEAPVTRRDRVVHRARTRRPRPRPLLGDLPAATAMHLHLSADESIPRAVARVPRQLQGLWQLDHTWEVPLHAVRAAARRVRRRGKR